LRLRMHRKVYGIENSSVKWEALMEEWKQHSFIG